jgi:hypothetical protein
MQTQESCGQRPGAVARTGAAWVAGVSLILGGASAFAAERIELRGAQASEAVVPESLDVDLRDLPAPQEWQPGDAIKEIPRRHQRPIKGIVDPPVGEAIDPLLELQEAEPSAPDFDFATPSVNIAGQGYTGVNPADPNGDVGPSHYIQAINQSSGSRITVYSKTGTVLSGPFTLASLGGTGNCATGLGDPIVLYDPLANRWLLSEFSSAGNRLCVYISKTADPISGGWWAYNFTAPNFPDYPKYGVWPDAYYVGTNEGTPAVYAFDRAKMLNGQAATSQRFTATALSGFGFQMLTPADLDGATAPPAGAPGVFIRHRDSEAHGSPGAADTLELFAFSVNWTTPSSSTFTGPSSVNVTEFDSALCGLTSFNCFPQPGSSTTLDPLREVVMFRAQYRNRGSFESLVGNLVTDVNGADRGGIRWFELRKSGSNPWALHMEGTYSPDTTNRWMGSAAVDKDGNLAVGYSVSASTSVYPGLRFAGRLAGDPSGSLAQGETTLVAGSAANASNRWGDYASLSVDPSDDCTFWFTGMYSPSSSWGTRIGAFKFAACGGTPTPDFTIGASPSSLSIVQGGSGASTVTVTSTNGFNSAVALSCTGLPAGVTCGFSPSSVTPPSGGSANSTLTVSVGGSTAAGSYSFNVVGTSGALSHSTPISLTVTPAGGGGGPQNATYDATLRAPKCGTVGSSCDSGASLLLGRNSLGPEPNQPNTIAGSCADGASGTFHSDESNDRLKVSTLDATDFAAGKTVRIDATVWAWSTPSSDKLDLYYAANANSPSWTLIGTLTPTVGGSQVLSATYTLPSGALQAVRARFRYQGSAAACGTGSYDDHDDLVFAVGGGGPTPDFGISASPSSLSIAQGGAGNSTVTVTSLNGFSSAVGLSCTGLPSGVSCGFAPSSVTPPSGGSANSTLTVSVGSGTATGSYSFSVVGTSGALSHSTPISLTVTTGGGGGPQTATYDATLRAPKCAVVGSSCDSGASLLLGRATKGPEPNQPNTINASCADGTSGTFHVDESNDRLKVSTLDATSFAAGKTVRIDATVWAYSSYTSDKLDLYYAANANSPSWTFIGTLTPTAAGAQTLSATYTLPSGTLQAIRAQFRYNGSAGTCTTGGYNDRDDLIFAVQ